MKYLLLSFFYFLASFLQAQNAISVSKEMFTAISGMQTVNMKMESYERIGNKYVTTKFMIKRSRVPLNIYYKQFSPTDGSEVMLNKSGKVWVNPGTFPWITLELDINSSLLRKDQHHCILDSGYDYFILLLSDLFKKYSDSLSKYVVISGTEKINNSDCYKISFTNPNYRLYAYKTIKEESPLSLASKFKIPEYKIGELNNIASVTDKIPVGTSLKLPNDYAKSMILWLDKKTKIPLKMEVYDEKGLYEKYLFTEVVINPVFKQDEFEKEYSEYNFK